MATPAKARFPLVKRSPARTDRRPMVAEPKGRMRYAGTSFAAACRGALQPRSDAALVRSSRRDSLVGQRFTITGANPATGRAVELVVVEESAADAHYVALEMGLRRVVVTPVGEPPP